MTYPPLDTEAACDGTLTVNGVLLHNPAWTCPDLSVLWGTSDRRGNNRLIPGVRGMKAYRRRETTTRYSIPLLVSGLYLHTDGSVNADPVAGLEVNMAYLHANVFADPGTSSGLVPLIWTKPSGATLTVNVQVLGYPNPTRLVGAMLRGTMEIEATNGDLHL